MLKESDLKVSISGKAILSGVSFELKAGDWLMLLGPNGAGKSTLIRAMAQAIPYAGSVQFEGQDLKHMKPRARAARLGVLSQSHHPGYAFTVQEVVRLGRYAAQGGLFDRGGDPEGQRMVEEAISRTGLEHLRHQSVLSLSGGELQRAFLAQLFAQDPQLLLLDEPANHLDLQYQQQLFALLSDWLKSPGRAIISVVHDLSLARKYGRQALLLDKGQQVALGNIDEALQEDSLRQVYQMDVGEWMRGLLRLWGE